MNKEKILDLLSELDNAARLFDYDYGLPIRHPSEEEKFVQIVETWLAAQSLNVKDGC